MRAALLLTCYNRKDRTLSCLTSIHAQCPVNELDLSIYLVDDGSNDGTSDAVSSAFPAVNILEGNGRLFWNGGMNMAWRAARKEDFDYYIWINDDVDLRHDALQVMFNSLREAEDECGTEAIVVGSFCESGRGTHSYGGFKVNRTLLGLATTRIIPNGIITKCDTFNGNFVLIPDGIVEVVGLLDSRYTHSFGDKDYGLRCKRNGIPMYVAPNYVGNCSRNDINGTWLDPMLPISERYRRMRLPTGLPPSEYFYACRKNSGSIVGGIALVKLYLRLLFPRYWSSISRRESGE